MIDAPVGFKAVVTPCQNNPDMWFSASDNLKEYAKGICGTCPFKVECRLTAIENQEEHGIWGGEDFNGREYENAVTLCRQKKHVLPTVRENNVCHECRKETRSKWEKEQNDQRSDRYKYKLAYKRATRKKNEIGGTCYTGKHVLTEENTKVRPNDGALMCTDCLKKRKIRSDTRSATGRDMNMGSSNRGGRINRRNTW